MSQAATQPNSLVGTIESDIKEAGQWLVTTGEGVALFLWDTVKALVIGLTEAQAQVVANVLNRLDTDAMAGKSIEEIETDVLNEAVVNELAILKTIASNTLQAVIASFKAANT